MSKGAAAGDISIERVQLISASGRMWEVTPQLASMTIYEDVLQPFMTCKIVLKDAIDFLNKFQFIGEELCIITYKTPGFSAKLNMVWYISQLSDKYRLHEREAMYVLRGVSIDCKADMNLKISKTFKGKVSDIAFEILKTDPQGLGTGRDVFIEDTPQLTKFTSNFWAPAYALNYIASTSINPKGSPTYLFYENREGFHFKSIQTIYEPKAPNWKFMHGNYSRDTKKGIEKDKDYMYIQDFNMPESFNYVDRLRSGMYTSRMFMYDLTTKMYHRNDFKYTPMDIPLNDRPLWIQQMSDPAAVHMFEPRYLNNMPGYGDVTNTNTIQKRISLLKQITASKLEITVLGKTEYTIGRLVEINIPQNAQLRKSEPGEDFKDHQASGLYMIGALSHEITRQRHYTTMELIKDSYLEAFFTSKFESNITS